MTPTTPTRVVDTRDRSRALMNMGTAGFPLAANTTKTIQLAGDRGIPGTASVISANVAVVSPSGNGSLTIWDCGKHPPIQSLNFRQGRTVANGVQAQLSGTGTVCVRSTATTHVIIDVTGWWT
jgi:hypothetical protein